MNQQILSEEEAYREIQRPTASKCVNLTKKITVAHDMYVDEIFFMVLKLMIFEKLRSFLLLPNVLWEKP